MQPPTTEMIYDSLAQLMQERKIYQTAKGYFIVTPEYVKLPVMNFSMMINFSVYYLDDVEVDQGQKQTEKDHMREIMTIQNLNTHVHY